VRVHHNRRDDSGSWQDSWGSVEGQSGSIGNIRAVADAAISGDTHVLAINSDGKLLHTIRHSSGTWDDANSKSLTGVSGTILGTSDTGSL
jgi:hypothetical protein